MTPTPLESPAYLRTSLAAAMTLGFTPGIFYRDARLYCINLLLTYESGCSARCAYCGLSGKRPGKYSEKSFIRVPWPAFPLDEIIHRAKARPDRVKRFCVSMVTRKRAVAHTLEIVRTLREHLDVPVSVLLAPTLLKGDDLKELKAAGADKAGVAVDLATPELFDRHRGKGVNGPHHWDVYWDCLARAVDLFGRGNAGPHFMVGMGETEQQMCAVIQQARDMGGRTHLFSFYPEPGSPLADRTPPPMERYRRIQLARYLIDNRAGNHSRFVYDEAGKLLDFGVSAHRLDRWIDCGDPFRTSGCTGRDGQVACNRPYGNSRPGPGIRNFPFPLTPKDVQQVRSQMAGDIPAARDGAPQGNTGPVSV